MPSDNNTFNQGALTSFLPTRDRKRTPRGKTLLITDLARFARACSRRCWKRPASGSVTTFMSRSTRMPKSPGCSRRAFIDNVLAFCGIDLDETQRAGLLQHVQPNRSQYVSTSKRSFEGISDSRLIGWARHIGNLAPVLLDLLIDDKLAATFQATDFRDDLLAAGMGNGNHAFSLDLDSHRICDASRIRLRFNRRTTELANSGMSAAQLKALREPR